MTVKVMVILMTGRLGSFRQPNSSSTAHLDDLRHGLIRRGLNRRERGRGGGEGKGMGERRRGGREGRGRGEGEGERRGERGRGGGEGNGKEGEESAKYKIHFDS